MTIARVSWPFLFLVALAACSGNLGSGQSTLPGMPQNGSGTTVQQVAVAAPTATPNSASGVVTLSDSTAPQALPAVMGYSGSITFVKPNAAPSATPNPKATPSSANSAPPAPVSLGITASVVDPPDAPHFSPLGKRRGKHDPTALTPLLFITLLSPTDVTLAQYPKIAVDVPRDIAAKHRDDTYALALYDPQTKDKSFQLAVAERDFSSPAPGTEPTSVPTAVPAATPMGLLNVPVGFTPPPVGSGLSASTLPPERVAFTATANVLTLQSNRPAIFALYAVPPQPTPSPSPLPSATPTAVSSASPTPATSTPTPTPAASVLPVPARS
jgi:hypothetical protein